MIKEYLTLRKAKQIQKKFREILPFEIECSIVYDSDGISNPTLRIRNRYGANQEISRNENEIKELINIIFDSCKRFHCNFTFHSHGLDYVYISIDIKG